MLYNINYESLKEIYQDMKLKKEMEKRIFKTYDNKGNVHYINPINIEKVIYSNEAIKACTVVKKIDDIYYYVPVAFITLKSGYTITKSLIDIISVCKEKLASHEIPVDIKLLDKMPLKKDGQIDYKVLENNINEDYYNYNKKLHLKNKI